MHKIKRLLTKDFQWKVLSVILAVALWIVGINVTDPIMSGRDTITLEIKGMDVLDKDKKMLLNEAALKNTSISVEVRGKASEVSNLKGKLYAYIDLSVFDILGANQPDIPLSTIIHVDKTGNFDFDILKVSPNTASVTIDDRITVTKAVSLNDNGTVVAEGYAYTSPIIEPEVIEVTGASTQVRNIKTLSVPVDLTGATDTIRFNGIVKAYDEYSREVSIDIEDAQVSVTIPVSKVGSVPVSAPSYTGKPAEGYAVSGIEYDLKELEIMGSKEEVEEFIAKKIKLTPVNIEGKSTTQRETQDLRNYLTGTKLNLVNNTPYECSITVWIEPLVTKTLIIPIDAIEKKGYTLGAQIMSTEIEVEVEGLRRAIDALTELEVSIDLSGLELGQNAVNVVVSPPKGITIKQQTETVDVLVTELTAEQEEEL